MLDNRSTNSSDPPDYDLPHRSAPDEDFDMASFGVVKVLEDYLGHSYPDMPWEPKAAFRMLGGCYRSPGDRPGSSGHGQLTS